METKEFKKIVMQSDDKMAILTNSDIINKYKISLVDLCNTINENLNDEEKLKILRSPGTIEASQNQENEEER